MAGIRPGGYVQRYRLKQRTMNSATRTFKHTMDECMNEERKADEDEPGTVQPWNEERRKTQLCVEECHPERKLKTFENVADAEAFAVYQGWTINRSNPNNMRLNPCTGVNLRCDHVLFFGLNNFCSSLA